MIWFLERNSDLLICEIRRSLDGTQYEFETAPGDRPPQTDRYESASELIKRYLQEQSTLRAQGWRPRSDISLVEE
jgi:hypothetical protein